MFAERIEKLLQYDLDPFVNGEDQPSRIIRLQNALTKQITLKEVGHKKIRAFTDELKDCSSRLHENITASKILIDQRPYTIDILFFIQIVCNDHIL